MRTGETARILLNKCFDRHMETMGEVAGRMGWTYATASKKLNNPKTMTFKEAIRFCALSGYTLDELSKM
jgi:hypothetical protein